MRSRDSVRYSALAEFLDNRSAHSALGTGPCAAGCVARRDACARPVIHRPPVASNSVDIVGQGRAHGIRKQFDRR